MATTRIATYPADIVYETALNVGPLSASPPPLWTNITSRVLGKWSTQHGASYMLGGRTSAGTWKPALDNRDGALDPGNPAGAFWPNLAAYKGLRIRMPFGVNLLTVDQATAGEQSGLLNAVPSWLNVVNDYGYPLSITTSGSAYQGTQVYQAVLPSAATQFATILLVKNVPVVPRQAYSFQAQARITSGNSVSTNAAILWYDSSGNSLSSTGGTASTITSGSSTWVQVSASTAAAPAGAYSAQLKVEIASGTLTATTTWQVDGLQWENSAYPTPWQTPGTLGANLLPRAVATGTASIDPTSDSAANYFASVAGSIARATNLTAAPNGATTAVAWSTPAGTTNTTPFYCGAVAASTVSSYPDGPVADCIQVTAGLVYTASAYLMRASSADATVQVQAGIRWYNSAGTLVSVSNGAATTVPAGSWARISVANATAPAGAVWGRCRFFISSPASTTATNTIYSTGWQMEQATSASTWVDPGPTYFAWWGAWEQFPQVWRLSGTWGELDAVGSDVLAGLAQYTVQQPFVEEVLALNPDFFYQLSDPAGSTSCSDSAGKRVPCPIENSPFGIGALALGSGITANTAGSAFLGTSGPVATFNNNPSQGNTQEAQTFLALHETTATPGPPPPTNYNGVASNPAWTRMIAFRCPSIPASGNFPTLWMVQAASYSSDQSFYLVYVNPTSGKLSFQESAANGSGPLYTSAGNVCDGNWHLLAISYTAGLTQYFDVFLDGVRAFHDNNAGAGWTGPTSILTDVVGANVIYGRNAYVSGWVGDVAHVIQFPAALSTTQATNLYNSWRTASSGESSGARVQRLLSWVGYVGPVAIDSGSTQTMGPATDLANQSALNGFNAILTTENGDGYAGNGGVLTFKARSARYNSSPVFIFGEGPPRGAPGEWPAEDVQLPTDPMNCYNIIPTQQYSTGQTATAQDTSSQTANWPRTMPTRTINSTSYAEVQAAGQYLLSQAKTPRMRLSSMTLHPNAVPGLFQVCAQLEKGLRIRVMKRPPYRSFAAPIQCDCFVERVEWNLDPRSGEVTVRVEASPADPATYWVLAALRTTLAAQAASGQNKATINALPDAAVNTLARSLPYAYQLTFDPGLATQETMTIAPGGIPSTSLGYTTAQITFTTNFQFTHAANAVVCEPIPAGYTDPTTWDAFSVLGVAYTTVVSGGGSGTNNVTVGPLPDGAVNALGSNWNTGDQITLSPGTANAETVTILSVAPSLPGYTSCQITFTANLAHSHAAGDYVCDPLPAGVTSPTAVAATTRLSY